jgi:hypothetical protein
MKKEKADAKSNQMLGEQEANEIGIGFFETIFKWAVHSGTMSGIFAWAFLCTQRM